MSTHTPYTPHATHAPHTHATHTRATLATHTQSTSQQKAAGQRHRAATRTPSDCPAYRGEVLLFLTITASNICPAQSARRSASRAKLRMTSALSVPGISEPMLRSATSAKQATTSKTALSIARVRMFAARFHTELSCFVANGGAEAVLRSSACHRRAVRAPATIISWQPMREPNTYST